MRNPPSPHPEIDLSRCTGCGACVQVCPEHAIGKIGSLPRIEKPELCTLCALCEEVCPTNAISVPFVIGWAEAM